MTPQRLPAAVLQHPDVGQKHTILDHPAEIFNTPLGVDRSDHHLIERGRLVHFDLDRFDFPALDRVEPFGAMHEERAGRPSSDEDEIGVNEGAQLIHIAMAQGIAPFAFEILDQPPVLLVSQKGVLLSPASL